MSCAGGRDSFAIGGPETQEGSGERVASVFKPRRLAARGKGGDSAKD
jgi:hypothetical protein